MINSNKIFIIIFLLIISISIFSIQNADDDLIVNKISQMLIEEYDKYANYTFLEKLVLKIGRTTYVDNINIWQKNYTDIDNIKIKLHPKLEDMAKIVDKNLEADRAKYFRKLLEELTFLGFKNLQIYYYSVKEYLNNNKLTYLDINIKLIDDSCNIKFYNTKKELYAREDIIKNEIREFMKDEKLKHKMAFYSFAFKFLNKIRIKIIEKDMKKMLDRINENKPGI